MQGLDIPGERWTLLIRRELLGGPRRYSGLRAELPGIATNLLAERLKELENVGLVDRAELPPQRARPHPVEASPGSPSISGVLLAFAPVQAVAKAFLRVGNTISIQVDPRLNAESRQ